MQEAWQPPLRIVGDGLASLALLQRWIMIARGAGVLLAIIAARRVGGWSGYLLRTLLGYGPGSFIFAGGCATISGCGASRLRPLVQTTIAASVAAGRLYSRWVDIPVLIKNVVAGQKLYQLAGGRPW